MDDEAKGQGFDLLPQIKQIVRDAISDGLIKSETVTTFDQKVRLMRGKELETYLQDLWDKL